MKTASTALGMYIRTLREASDMTSLDVAVQSSVNPNYIWRLETTNLRPSADKLASVVRTVGGTFDDAANLILDPTATEDDGRRLAQKRLQENAAGLSHTPLVARGQEPRSDRSMAQPEPEPEIVDAATRAIRDFVKTLSYEQASMMLKLLPSLQRLAYALYATGLLDRDPSSWE